MRFDRKYTYETLLFLICNYFCSVSSSKFLDCVVNDWEPWSKCNRVCSIGESIRKRTVKQEANGIFSKKCPPLTESKECGEKKNCEYVCNEQLGVCQCPSGYELDSDHKSCRDVNECFPNNGLGSCHHICKNLNSTYKCSCHDGFILAPNNHDCIFYNKKELCSPEIQHFVNGTCMCSNHLSGLRCDRNKALCENVICEGKTICSSFIQAPNKCVKQENQLSLLLRIPYSMYNTEIYKYSVDLYLESLIEGFPTEIKSLTELNNIKQINGMTKKIYVEGTRSIKVTSAYTYVIFTVFEYKNNKYKETEISKVCDILSTSIINCVDKNDCEILQNNGYECPSLIYKTYFGAQTGKLKKNTFLWLYCLISIVVVIGLVGYLVFKLKKPKANKKENLNNDSLLDSRHTARFQRDQNDVVLGDDLINKSQGFYLDKCNSLYGENSERLYESIDNLSIAKYHDSGIESKQKLVVDLNTNYDVPKHCNSERCNDSLKYSNSERYTEPPKYLCPPEYTVLSNQ